MAEALRNLAVIMAFVALAAIAACWVNNHAHIAPDGSPTPIVNTNSPIEASGP
jgi:hypothetical protein